jgi:hypothetical protein
VLVPVQITTIRPDVPAIFIAVHAIATKISAIVINIALFSMCFSEITVAIRAIAIDISFIGSDVPALFSSIFHIAIAHVLAQVSAVLISVAVLCVNAHRRQQHQTKTQDLSSHIL